ncbi:hypothetical protein GCM10012279_49630 [Micromonospora yangpuensis]|nr:hypothetical protein GCM10012279_49630 [Micromonospora yangpuensis]
MLGQLRMGLGRENPPEPVGDAVQAVGHGQRRAAVLLTIPINIRRWHPDAPARPNT